MSLEAWATIGGLAIQTAIFLLGGYTMVIRSDMSSKDLKEEVSEMKEELEKLATVITVQAVQTIRIDNLNSMVASLDRRIEEMRRGVGWVQNQRQSVDGEYP